MRKILLLLCVALACDSIAQNSTNELLEAKKVTQTLHIRLSTGVDKKIEIRPDNETFKPLLEKRVFSIPKQESGVNLIVDFLNPLRYEISVSDTLLPDASAQAVTKFLEALTIAASRFGVAAASANKTEIPKRDVVSLEEEYVRCLIRDSARKEEIVQSVSALKERYIIDVMEQVRVAIENVRSKQTLKDYKEAVDQFGKEIKIQEKELSDFEKNIAEFKTLYLSLRENDIEDFVVSNKVLEIRRLFGDYLKSLEKEAEDRKALINSMKELLKQLLPVAENYTDIRPDENFINMKYLKAEEEKMRDVKTTIKDRSVNISKTKIEMITNSKKIADAEFRVRTYQRWVPEFTMGIFNSVFSVPTYSAVKEGDKLVVSEEKKVKYYGGPAAFLNLVKNSDGSLVNFMAQLGIGTTDFPVPSLLFGPGIRFKTKTPFAISAGGLLFRSNELNKLSKGSEINDSKEIDNDIKSSLKLGLSWYICIQLKI
ncbi:hypothetical protein [Larkinella sp.]|uniref:hypothetical protein n=1 Tax=Larkinella sp. TaxID=2034517 RepID=UPI003BAB785F